MRQETELLPGQGEATDVAVQGRHSLGAARRLGPQGFGRHPDLVGGDDMGLLEHGLLVPCVVSLYQLVLVPFEVAQEDSDCGGWKVGDATDLLDNFTHVTDNILCT